MCCSGESVSHYGETKERLIRSRPWRPMRVRRVVPGRGMSSQASSHDLNRNSSNKTSEGGEAKDLRIKRLARKTALQRGKLRWTQQREQRLCKPRAGAWPAPLLLVFHLQRRSCSGGCTYVVLLRLRTGCARGGTCNLQHVKIRFLQSVATRYF